MSSQLTIEAALTNLEAANQSWLAWARSEAKTISAVHGSVTSDDIREAADKCGLLPDSSHAWGALFLGKGWRCIGRERSRYASSNGRFINRWVWKA